MKRNPSHSCHCYDYLLDVPFIQNIYNKCSTNANHKITIEIYEKSEIKKQRSIVPGIINLSNKKPMHRLKIYRELRKTAIGKRSSLVPGNINCHLYEYAYSPKVKLLLKENPYRRKDQTMFHNTGILNLNRSSVTQ